MKAWKSGEVRPGTIARVELCRAGPDEPPTKVFLGVKLEKGGEVEVRLKLGSSSDELILLASALSGVGIDVESAGLIVLTEEVFLDKLVGVGRAGERFIIMPRKKLPTEFGVMATATKTVH